MKDAIKGAKEKVVSIKIQLGGDEPKEKREDLGLAPEVTDNPEVEASENQAMSEGNIEAGDDAVAEEEQDEFSYVDPDELEEAQMLLDKGIEPKTIRQRVAIAELQKKNKKG